METVFGPRGDSAVLALTASSQAFALGTMPAINPAIRLISLNPSHLAWYLKFGTSGAVTVSRTDGMRLVPGSKEKPVVIPVPTGSTHVAILCEGASGDILASYGGFDNGEFSPVGASQIVAVTTTDQRIALPVLSTSQPAIRLISTASNIEALWIKFGDVTVVGSVTTSMKVFPGSVENPTVIPVTNSETHLSIFCEGVGGDIVLSPGGVNYTTTKATSVLMSAAPRILGLDAGAPAFAKELTLSQVLDFIGGAAQGDILYRGAAAWARLAAGTANFFLQTRGAGADPQYAGGLVLLASGVLSGATSLDFVLTSYTAYRGFKVFASLLPATEPSALNLRFSSNGGSSYDAGATDYAYMEHFGSATGAHDQVESTGAAQIVITGNVGGGTREGVVFESTLIDPFSTARDTKISTVSVLRTDGALAVHSESYGIRNAGQDTDAIRYLFSGGNMSGNYALYGIL
jgi:hypothetical protein